MQRYGVKLDVPGLLFVDTPGHEAFVNLRKRGGSIADIAILVVDAERGLENQTVESIEILKEKKTPFLVALNKIDRIPGWKPNPSLDIVANINSQSQRTRGTFDSYIYKLIGDLGKLGFMSDRFDRVKDFQNVLTIVPVSAATGEGLPELLLMTAGLCQVFLKRRLTVNPSDTKGIVLEVKEELGLGTTVDAIIYDGVLRKGDTIVLGGYDLPVVSKVKAILLPKLLGHQASSDDRFREIPEAPAAMGVKIVGPNLEAVIPGSPIYVPKNGVEQTVKSIMKELDSVRIKSDSKGVVLKADALGSLEALVDSLRRRNIPVRYADIGNISKRDVLEASITKKEEALYGVILAFNVKFLAGTEDEAKALNIPVFKSSVIYEIVEQYSKWLESERSRILALELSSLIRPAKFRIMPGYLFRRSNPVIVGVEVLGGVLKPGYPLVSAKCVPLGTIMQIQHNGKPVEQAEKGQNVAVSIKGDIMIGRQVEEGETVYVKVPEEHLRLLKTKYKDAVQTDELALIEELQAICVPL
jgi:translation initiation factor 5B